MRTCPQFKRYTGERQAHRQPTQPPKLDEWLAPSGELRRVIEFPGGDGIVSTNAIPDNGEEDARLALAAASLDDDPQVHKKVLRRGRAPDLKSHLPELRHRLRDAVTAGRPRVRR
jgi:hypothetical protein